MAISQAMKAETVVGDLVEEISRQLDGPDAIAGGLILATAAAGREALEVARGLAAHWPNATFFGTSFEGVLAEGRIYRHEPAFVVLSWPEGPIEPIPLIFGPEEQDAPQIAEAVLDASGRSSLIASDLVLLFPDALGCLPIESVLAELGPLLGPASLAGAAAVGLDGHPALGFLGGEALNGALIGLFLPGVEGEAIGTRPRIRCAGASRSASPWLEITRCRERWVDTLDAEPALDWVRRQLGLESRAPIEPFLDRLLVRTRRPAALESGSVRRTSDGRAVEPAEEPADGWLDYEERYVVGIDDPRGAFSLPGAFRRGDELAFALPDAQYARERLRTSIDELAKSPFLLQFTCRARDEALYGDPELESAWVSHHAPERRVLGTISPFQIAMNGGGEARLLVHTTVLTALGR